MEILDTVAFTGDHGLTLHERAPFGVLLSITPSTNPTETVINNAIGMIAAGNSVIFNVHPNARQWSHADHGRSGRQPLVHRSECRPDREARSDHRPGHGIPGQ